MKMAKIMTLLLSAFLFLSVSVVCAASAEREVTEEFMEANQIGSEECMAGTLYLQSVCYLADGDTNKCIDLMFLYGIPCVIFSDMIGDEITTSKCLIGYLYILNVCGACDGNVLKCIGLASSTFYFPCLYRALNSDYDSTSGE
jgi:hypothetical protein